MRGFDHDLVILGAGPAALAAIRQARAGGFRVAVVERAAIGGTCLNAGCVSSKVLLKAIRGAPAPDRGFGGVTVRPDAPDLAALVGEKDTLVSALRDQQYREVVDAEGVELIEGEARFVDPATVSVNGRVLRGQAFLVATGAGPVAPLISGLRDHGFLTSTTALQLTEVPGRLAVLGTTGVGLELGQCFSRLGSDVVFLDAAERIAPHEEPEVSSVIAEVFHAEGVGVIAPARIRAIERKRWCQIRFESGGREQVVEVDEVLVAVGRRPNTGDLGLSEAGVSKDDRGAIVVDRFLRTTNPRVFAAGDVTSGYPLVCVAAAQGEVAARNALLHTGETLDLTGVPRVTFTTPEIAVAGLTEADARVAGHEVKTAVLELARVPRAIVNGDQRGLVKLVADAEIGRLLGASMVGEGAGEAIQAAVLAIRAGMTTAELASTFYPHLTMVEGLKLAAQSFVRDPSTTRCCGH